MTRIAELQQKYPTLPLDVIAKYEVLTSGVQDSDDLDKVSSWMRPLFTYQAYNYDVSLKEIMERRPERRSRPGYVLRPEPGYFRSGLGFRIMINTKSPYSVREISEGRFGLYEGEEKVDVDLFFRKPKDRPSQEPVTSKGTPLDNLLSHSGPCFKMCPVRYCEYFSTGEQCKFCDFNVTQNDARGLGIPRSTSIDLEETIEAYRILGSESRFVEGRFEMGGVMSGETENKLYFQWVGEIARALPYKPNLTIHTEAMDRKDLLRLKDMGLDCPTFQLEVWDPENFAAVCPGKARTRPHERWMEALLDAVDIYGPGQVGCNTPIGLTLMTPNGHKTWQEARDAHIEANRWGIKHGVMAHFCNLRLPPGSVYGATPSLREKLPPSDYILDAIKDHHETSMEYGLYQTLNRFMYCGLDCTSYPYIGDVGILAMAGDCGKWMADVVPAELNWMAQFIAWMEAAVTPR